MVQTNSARTRAVVIAMLVALFALGAQSAGRGEMPRVRDTVPSRKSTVSLDRKVSLRGKEVEARMEEKRAENTRKLPVDPTEELEQRLREQLEQMQDPRLDDEHRALHQREYERDAKKLSELRKAKKYDPYKDMKKREAHGRQSHHVEVEVPDVDPPEPIVDLAHYNATNLDGLFNDGHDGYFALMFIEAECEFCEEGLEIFKRVSAKFADFEFPLPHRARRLRYAYLNVSENRTLYNEMMHKLHFRRRSKMNDMPSTILVHLRQNWNYDGLPHYIDYRHGQYESDLEHNYQRIVHMVHSFFRNEDELMHCAFETSHDGVAVALMLHHEQRNTLVQEVTKALRKSITSHHHHVPMCQYVERAEPGENVTIGDPEFLAAYNPDNADIAAFFLDPEDHDQVSAEYFTFSSDLKQHMTVQVPKKLMVVETMRLRRWLDSVLARRHTKSGRRFLHVRHRHEFKTHGGMCPSVAIKGDVVTASIRAESVDHKLVFADITNRKFIAGEPIPELPPYLHNILIGKCPGTYEIISPAKEGFHAELVTLHITQVDAPELEVTVHPEGKLVGADSESEGDVPLPSEDL